MTQIEIRELLIDFASKSDKYNVGSKVRTIDRPKYLQKTREDHAKDVDEFLKNRNNEKK